ncbi:MAG: DUF4175 family protein [Candidatus Competibacteraceae bacterium]|nr:DUF4175 family protein [Candidatus Competibacteraceae bacterium]
MSEYPAHPPEQALERLYQRVRRQLRSRRILEALAVALLLLLLITLLAATIMAALRFEETVVAWARLGVYSAALILGAVVLVPLLRPLPAHVLAHYLEDRHPQLDALLITATQTRDILAGPGDASPVLARALIARAVARCQESNLVEGLERARLKRAGDWLSGTLALALALALFGPLPLRHGLGLLADPGQEPALGSPYTLQVLPGDLALLAGEDLRIQATSTHFRPKAMELVTRGGPDQPWQRTAMTAGQARDFESFLFDLETPLEYHVEAEGIRSGSYHIEIIPRPTVTRIDLHYHFPAHTGRPPERVEDGGEISAVQGTRVELTITPDRPVARGRLLLDGQHPLPLEIVQDGTLTTMLTLEQDGHYHVELPAQGRLVPASPEYAIATWADRLPSVQLLLPGRDHPATPVEEVAFRVRADDDVAIRELELVLSVNGGPDQVVPLLDGPSPTTQVTGEHTLYLEERALTPGDMIAYYVRARDRAADPRRLVTTDMYFIDVRPFERHFHRSAGGRGGGGGGGNESELSAQQRSLVVALFKTTRDRPRLEEGELVERLAILAQAQGRIHERTAAIVRRLNARPVVELNKGYRRMAEELPKAASAMIRTAALLEAGEVDQALPQAREALLYLQRADAAFRDVQVAQSQAGGGGGGASADDLANLFRLEMDKFRNPYADVQRGGQGDSRQRQIDETLRRLEELARRQQQEIERARRRAEPGQGSAASQQALAEELERMIRELERLTRQRPDPQLADSLEQLRQAARAMGQAGQQAGGDAATQALEQLRQARRLLDPQDARRLAGEIGRALEQSEAILDQHRAIQRQHRQSEQAGMERAVTESQTRAGELADGFDFRGDQGREAAHRSAQGQGALAQAVAELGERLPRLADQAAAQGQEAAQGHLQEADRALRQGRLADRLERDGPGLSDRAGAEGNAQPTERALKTARDGIAAALEAVGSSTPSPRQQAWEELRQVVRELEATRGQLVERARQGPALGGRGGNLDAADLERLEQNLQNQARRLAAAFDPFTGQPRQGEDIRALIDAIATQARRGGISDPGGLAERYDHWLDALKVLERQLRPEEERGNTPVVTIHRAEPGADDRQRVEAYYRNLSEAAGP